MQLLLTSAGFYHDNELDKPLTPLIERLACMLGKPFVDVKILFVPTASMQDTRKGAAITKRLCNELLSMGFLPCNIIVHDIDGSITESEAMHYDAIYFSGGNTPYLARRVKQVGFDKVVLAMVQSGKVYIGMSAGSMLAMDNFNVDRLPEVEPAKYVGLALIDAYFTVHCAPDTPNRTDFPKPHYSLNDRQALAVTTNGVELICG